jgi:hypothetical protein
LVLVARLLQDKFLLMVVNQTVVLVAQLFF